MAKRRQRQDEAAAMRGKSPHADPRRLDELRRQIQSGEYESDEKLAVTVARLLADLRRTADQPPATRGDGSGGERP